MINFKLSPENFNNLMVEHRIVPITFLNLEHYIKLIETCIVHFNEEIEWDDMHTITDAIKRIKNGMVMYVGMTDTGVLGYVWFTDHLDGRRLFNLFVRNKVDKKDYSGKEFLSNVISKFESTAAIYSEVDEWNEKSIKLFQRLGFQVQ